MTELLKFGQVDRASAEALASAWREGGPALWEEYGCQIVNFIRHATRCLFTMNPDGSGLACADPAARPRERHWFDSDQIADAGEILWILRNDPFVYIEHPNVEEFLQLIDSLPARLIESAVISREVSSP